MKMTAQKDVSTKFHDGTKNKLDVIISQVDVKTHTTMTSKLFQDVKLELKWRHKLMSFFISKINNRKVLKMKNETIKKTTIRINADLWEQAGLKSECSRNELVERLLMDFVATEGSKDDYKRKIKECEQIISQEQFKIKQYKQAIKEIEKEEQVNAQNLDAINECYVRIDRYMKTHKTIPFALLKQINNTQRVGLDVLNNYCLKKKYEFEWPCAARTNDLTVPSCAV